MKKKILVSVLVGSFVLSSGLSFADHKIKRKPSSSASCAESGLDPVLMEQARQRVIAGIAVAEKVAAYVMAAPSAGGRKERLVLAFAGIRTVIGSGDPARRDSLLDYLSKARDVASLRSQIETTWDYSDYDRCKILANLNEAQGQADTPSGMDPVEHEQIKQRVLEAVDGAEKIAVYVMGAPGVSERKERLARVFDGIKKVQGNSDPEKRDFILDYLSQSKSIASLKSRIENTWDYSDYDRCKILVNLKTSKRD